MVSLDKLSKIGFGSYRVSSANQQHRDALEKAIAYGCNLLDTAPNYMNGKSEELIGEVVRNCGDNLFIISKVGYIQGDDLKYFHSHNFDDIIKINDSFWYSLDIKFIEAQINRILARLNRDVLDGFLLHNPEHYFTDESMSKEILYSKIENVFYYLEKLVRKGVIRYYGISSNTIPLALDNAKTLSLSRLYRSAEKVSGDHHFKIVQFPYNYYENDGSSVIHDENESLVALAKKFKLVTIVNRPLNAETKQGFIRLATYDSQVTCLNGASDLLLFENVFEFVLRRLSDQGMEGEWDKFPILVHLKSNWSKIGNPEAVEKIFYEHFYPFLNVLYENKIPNELANLLKELFSKAVLYSRKKMTERANELEQKLIASSEIKSNNDSFAYRMCQTYLDKGIDHVLVGLKNNEYVTEFQKGFSIKSSR